MAARGQASAAGASPSEVASRYLEALQYMGFEGIPARPARLAQWLGVSRPTVTVALQRMARDGLLKLAPNKEVMLTETGRAAADSLVRRHRIIERWLTDQLGMDWVSADEEAARLEHTVSEDVVSRIYERLGRPATCPHGNPIPGLTEREPGELSVAQLELGARARVTRISEVAEREAPLLLTRLAELGLVPGTRLEVTAIRPEGAMRLQLKGGTVELAADVADKVWSVPESQADSA